MTEAKQIISPFSGTPETRQTIDSEGNPTFVVTPQELTPFRARVADGLGVLSAIGLVISGFMIAETSSNPEELSWWVFVIGPFFGYPLYQAIWGLLFRKRSELVLGIDRFEVKTWNGWNSYDRKLPHKFTLVPHDRTLIEQEQHEFENRRAQLNGKVIRRTRYYGESYHLSFEYLGQRNDVLTIYGRVPALAVLTRLIACDEVLDAQARMGDGVALDPQEQWGTQPGDIPDLP